MKYLFFILIFVLGVQTIQSHDIINEVEKHELLLQGLSSNLSLISTSLNQDDDWVFKNFKDDCINIHSCSGEVAD